MSSPRPVLKLALNSSISDYLDIDNPEKTKTEGFLATAAASVSGMFSHGGEAGRKRALAYRDTISKSIENEDALVLQVVLDIHNMSSVLGSSRDLRSRLLEGLCAYFQLSASSITAREATLRRGDLDLIASATPHAAMILRNEKQVHRDAMQELLSGPLAIVRARVLQSYDELHRENRSAINNRLL